MKLEGLLQQKGPAILERWRLLIRETYPPETAKFLGSKKDQFANPVGHFIRHGTEAVLDQLLGSMDREAVRECMDPLVRIRAVQDFDPSEAVDFVFSLKKAVRKEMGGEIEKKGLSGELLELDSRIDTLARIAFDMYAKCREQIYEIRIKEIKKRSAVLLRRMNTLNDEPDLEGGLQGGEA